MVSWEDQVPQLWTPSHPYFFQPVLYNLPASIATYFLIIPDLPLIFDIPSEFATTPGLQLV